MNILINVASSPDISISTPGPRGYVPLSIYRARNVPCLPWTWTVGFSYYKSLQLPECGRTSHSLSWRVWWILRKRKQEWEMPAKAVKRWRGSHQDSSVCRVSTTLHAIFPGGSDSKESICNAGDARDIGSVLRLGRSPGGGNGNPLQYSCLENLMDRGAGRAIVHRVTMSQTWMN